MRLGRQLESLNAKGGAMSSWIKPTFRLVTVLGALLLSGCATRLEPAEICSCGMQEKWNLRTCVGGEVVCTPCYTFEKCATCRKKERDAYAQAVEEYVKYLRESEENTEIE